MDVRLALLEKTDIFGTLPADVVARVAERLGEVRVPARGVLFREGDPGESLFVLGDGLLKVSVRSPAGDELVLRTLDPPDVFGELSMIDGEPRSTTITAIEPSVIWELDRATLLELMREHPQLMDSLLRWLGVYVRTLTEQTSDLVFLDLQGRVAKLLLRLAVERGERSVEGGDVALDLPMTQSDLAAMVGGSRQSVNQILRAFERRGYLDVDGRQVVLHRLDRLRKRAGLPPDVDGPA